MKWRLHHLAVGLAMTACSEGPWPKIVPEPRPTPSPETRGGDGAGPSASPPVSSIALSDEVVKSLSPLFDLNDGLHAAFAGDVFEGVSARAVEFADKALAARPSVGDETVAALLSDIERRAREVARAGDIEAARLSYGELSRAMVTLASRVPALREGRHVFMCPMAKGYQKWLQKEPSLRNPYFGAKMLTCGENGDWVP